MSRISSYASGPGVVALAALLSVLGGCGQEELPPELPSRAIQWERISGAHSGQQRVISGIVLAVSDTQLAFEVGGLVETVEVNLGDRVASDQVLARLDPEPFELNVRDAQAVLSEALASQEVARADYERAASLFEANVASRQEYDRALAMRDSRDSQVEAAEARLNLARRDLRRSVLRAPFSGAISVREVDPAMKLASGQTVFEMDSGESGLRVEVQMPETLIAQIEQGDAATVAFPSIGDARIDVEGRTFAAIVSEVGTRAGVGNAFPVRADLVEPPPGLRPGMTAEVTFSVARDTGVADLEGFLVPVAAVVAEADDRYSAFVFDEATSTVRRTPIRSGGVQGNLIAILEGLEEGDIIATAGVPFLRDGQEVTLLGEHLMRVRR
jgi:RND family efflux transporter MFP subunit